MTEYKVNKGKNLTEKIKLYDSIKTLEKSPDENFKIGDKVKAGFFPNDTDFDTRTGYISSIMAKGPKVYYEITAGLSKITTTEEYLSKETDWASLSEPPIQSLKFKKPKK